MNYPYTTWLPLPRTIRICFVCALMAFSCLSSAQTNAATAPPDVRMLVDVSVSMHERDANKLRETALGTLVQQLPKKAMAGVWGYAQLTQRFANHAQSSALWKQVAVIHAEHLSPASKSRNPEQAFGNILWDLDKPDRAPVHVVWLSFSHAAVNYGSIKVTARVRRPPQLGVLVPAESMPSGLWRIPIENNAGVVEFMFSFAGNYLNGEGFFLKTKPVALSLPLAPDSETNFRFDAQGRRTDIDDVGQQSVSRVAEAAFETPAAEPTRQLSEGAETAVVIPP